MKTINIKEGEKTRVAFFDGMVISIKGQGDRKTFTVRRVGEANIGIERIFPISLPTIEKIEVVKKGTRGVKQAKLYYIREKSPKEIDKIYKMITVIIKKLNSFFISRSVNIEISIETNKLLVNCFASELFKKKTKNISKKIFLLIYFF